jgi:hypothetical protein
MRKLALAVATTAFAAIAPQLSPAASFSGSHVISPVSLVERATYFRRDYDDYYYHRHRYYYPRYRYYRHYDYDDYYPRYRYYRYHYHRPYYYRRYWY